MKKEICSFCGWEKSKVEFLIAGIDGHICGRCVEQAHIILEEEGMKFKSSQSNMKLILPN